MKTKLPVSIVLAFSACVFALDYQSLDINPLVADFHAIKAPKPDGCLLQKGDRLAICGDSITEQKMYSRIIETYLTVCVPELEISVRQYGWGGETATGFLGRMENDCLRFKPTLATTCYGMNDHRYQPYQEAFGKEYRDRMTAIVTRFKDSGARVIVGSPGCVGKKPGWQQDPTITAKDLNLSLLKFRNIGVEIAAEQEVAFADVYLPMLLATYKAQTLYGSDFHVAGDDGVHPDWAGHMIMAWAFLDAMGLDGQIGTITVDLQSGKTTVSEGHQVVRASGANSDAACEVVIDSRRYPFCDPGAPDKHGSGRAGMTLVPFNETLNRFMLVVSNTSAKRYRVAWGQWEHVYSAEQLKAGVNLAADYPMNPFVEPFYGVSEAVKRKQEYETHQIKTLFHGNEGKVDMDATVTLSEKARQRLADDIMRAFKPVTHTIRITAE